MIPILDFATVALTYKSRPQIVRVATERWVADHLLCPLCTGGKIKPHPNNHKAADFVCANCGESFQLKALSKPWGRSLTGAAYQVMKGKIQEGGQPNFLLMRYNYLRSEIEEIILIPREFITLGVLEARTPLRAGARRSGWVGYKLLLENIPVEGRKRVNLTGAEEPARVV